MYTNNRDDYRLVFFTTWDKYQKKLPLEPVEAQLIKVILQHPEYHALLGKAEAFQNQEFALDENPFFHMSLHQAIHDQLSLDQPQGIRQIQQQLLAEYKDDHQVQHLIMQCLYSMMYQSQQSGVIPSDSEYLQKLRSLIQA
ncbi:hypothetical protein AQUSIP_15360 [Aquicella siphonis]|uniref:DUF1841 domain-containing protein n=1 Tax=Aquicella siphonis TaxID=254247 RepID=A0A5E4PGR2_9COXI|nr:DUF1841 family protein [Aquicella siphonis]VVC76230.1 hypothetical protein AQUSIP_15360 [Aquicella siphonis]